MSPDPIARGRLGPLYQAIECASGSVAAIENVEFIDGDTASAWMPQLEYEMNMIQELHHPNLVEYNGLSLSDRHVHVISEHAAGGSLQRLMTDFGQLHRSIVPQYVLSLLHGLFALHSFGLIHGEASSARVFIGLQGVLKIGSYFPSLASAEQLNEQGALTGLASIPVSRPCSSFAEGMVRDIRSVLWLMVEMLIGGRVRGINLDPPRLLQLVAEYDVEQTFLSLVLEVLTELPRLENPIEVYTKLFGHTYMLIETWNELMHRESPQQIRLSSAALELEQCATLRAELSQAIDTWLCDFESKYRRPPKKKEWPQEMTENQVRVATLKIHMQDLHEIITHDTVNIFGLRKQTSQKCELRNQPADTLRDNRKRSTAQEAFLHQVSSRLDGGK